MEVERKNTSKLKQIRMLLEQQDSVVVPGVYDMVSAALASQYFDAVYMTGYGISASYLGVPDLGLATYTDMKSWATRMAQTVQVPLIADGDTGYGGINNVMQMILDYERAGVAGVQIEDQQSPKRCGMMGGIKVVPTEEMVRKINVAVACKQDKDFVVIARTDAYSQHGLVEALRRGESYVEAGADALLIEGVHSSKDLEKIATTFAGVPLVMVIPEGVDGALISIDELKSFGFKLIVFPIYGCLAATNALNESYRTMSLDPQVCINEGAPFRVKDFEKLMDIDRYTDIERNHGGI